MVETKGYTLEEVAIAFEGSGAYLANVDILPEVETRENGGNREEDDVK